MLIILGIIFLLIIIIIIVKINKNYNGGGGNEIENKYYDTTYALNGMPNGGFLVTILNNQTICPNYNWKSNNCIKNSTQCGELLDISDISNILSTLHTNGTGTSCYSIDTTYFRTDLPNYVFGPYKGLDMTIGLILDLPKLWEYIACMFPIDSGSISRYNCTCSNSGKCGNKNCENKNGSCSPTINPEWIGKGQNGWNEYLNKPQSQDLAMAGCGKMTPVCGLQEKAGNFILHNDSDAKIHNKNVIFKTTSQTLLKNWAWGSGNLPYSKYQWKEWIDATKYLYDKANFKNFVNLQQSSSGDGYRENEVDIIVPNKPRADSEPCKVIDEFNKVWQDCIIGVFSNGKTSCSNTDIVSKSIFGCNSKTCCCSAELSSNLAKSIADNFNKKLPSGKKPIKAYNIDTLNIMNFNWKNGKKSKLNIQEIK